jgi:hypothetical protein
MVNVSTFVVAALAFVSGACAAGGPVNPPANVAHARQGGVSSRNINVERMTNAKRLAMGLPPMAPQRRNAAQMAARNVVNPSQSATPGRTLTGRIQVSNANTGAFLGYVSKNYQLFGEYGLVDKLNQGLKVKIDGVTNGKSGPLQITNKNGDSTYPNVGAVSGYSNTNTALTAGSFNYVYIGGTAQTSPFATPALGPSAFFDATSVQEAIESAVWYFNTNNRRITFGWVNPDGTRAEAKLALYKPDGVLLAVADIAAFRAEFTGQTVPVTFTLVDD